MFLKNARKIMLSKIFKSLLMLNLVLVFVIVIRNAKIRLLYINMLFSSPS